LSPLLKTEAGHSSDVNSYKVIAIVNACSKLLESIMYKYIATFYGYVDEDLYQFSVKYSHSTDLCTYVFKNTADIILLVIAIYLRALWTLTRSLITLTSHICLLAECIVCLI